MLMSVLVKTWIKPVWTREAEPKFLLHEHLVLEVSLILNPLIVQLCPH